MIGTPERERWLERFERALCALGATSLARRLAQRRRAQRESDRWARARHGAARVKPAETPESMLRQGLKRLSEQRIAGELPAALGTCRELARDFAHSPEPWLAFAELGALAGARAEARLFACAEAIAAARGSSSAVERACRSFDFRDSRALARAFRTAGFRPLADWLAAS
jgi:hypothetical protein